MNAKLQALFDDIHENEAIKKLYIFDQHAEIPEIFVPFLEAPAPPYAQEILAIGAGALHAIGRSLGQTRVQRALVDFEKERLFFESIGQGWMMVIVAQVDDNLGMLFARIGHWRAQFVEWLQKTPEAKEHRHE